MNLRSLNSWEEFYNLISRGDAFNVGFRRKAVRVARMEFPQCRRRPERVIFVLGTSHSGSTLLGCILGACRDGSIFHIGEAYALFRPDRKIFNKPWKGGADNNDEFWKRLDYTGGIESAPEMIVSNCRADVIVDTGKNMEWVEVFSAYCRSNSIEVAYVMVMRSWESTLNSFRKRKLGDERWVRELSRQAALFAKYSPRVVYLDDLLKRPMEYVKDLCDDLKLPYVENKHEYWRFPQNYIGGATRQRREMRGEIAPSFLPMSD